MKTVADDGENRGCGGVHGEEAMLAASLLRISELLDRKPLFC